MSDFAPPTPTGSPAEDAFSEDDARRGAIDTQLDLILRNVDAEQEGHRFLMELSGTKTSTPPAPVPARPRP